MATIWNTLDAQNIIKRYLSGESEQRISKDLSVDRSVIKRCLLENGIARRGRSDGAVVRWSRMTERQRKHQVKSAHDAVRGIKWSHESLLKRAKTREQTRTTGTDNESRFVNALKRRGVEKLIPQHAIGPYNCDIAASPVAVEIYGGNWHFSGDHLRTAHKRIPYILNAGWHVLIVVAHQGYDILSSADYAAGFIQAMRSNKSTVRQYRMVRGDGKIIASASTNDNQIPLVPSTYRRQKFAMLHK